MKPTKTGFKSPTIDFFNPGREFGMYNLNGVEIRDDELYVIASEQRESRLKTRKVSIPRGSISSVYPNDLGGLSFDFSTDVEYDGNGGGAVHLKIRGLDDTFVFSYDMAARVKDGDEVVWQNYRLD